MKGIEVTVETGGGGWMTHEYPDTEAFHVARRGDRELLVLGKEGDPVTPAIYPIDRVICVRIMQEKEKQT